MFWITAPQGTPLYRCQFLEVNEMKDRTFVVGCLALLVGLALGNLLRKPSEVGRFVHVGTPEIPTITLDTKTGQLCRSVDTTPDDKLISCSALR